MNPLKICPMPTCGVLIAITSENSWKTEKDGVVQRFAFVATNSKVDLSFCSVQTAWDPMRVIRVLSRPALLPGYESGVVIEVYLSQDFGKEGDAVTVHFAQSGATVYFPPQPISD